MKTLGWLGIMRLGLVQAALGAIVVLTTSTLNRVMVVEMALPALLPGVLVATHYFVQISRPKMGHGSDLGHRRTPWIVGGMAVLALGGVLASVATVLLESAKVFGIVLAVGAFVLIGLGVSASGTSLLAMLATRVAPQRRGPAAMLVWMMMIFGFALTAGLAGHFLEPFSPSRLISVASCVSALALILSILAVYGVEDAFLRARSTAKEVTAPAKPPMAFWPALVQVCEEPKARNFSIFVFVSMLAFSAQDLVLEPFAGVVFGMTPGASTSLSGLQHAGTLFGMICAAAGCAVASRLSHLRCLQPLGSLQGWAAGGCLASGLALAALAIASCVGPGWPLHATVFGMGVANGAFTIGAIGSMMQLASQGHASQEGMRMGVWGAAQAMAFGLGGLVGTSATDLAQKIAQQPSVAYASVFLLEAGLFCASAYLAWRVGSTEAGSSAMPRRVVPGGFSAGNA